MKIQEYRQGIGWTLSVSIHALVLFTGILLVAEAPKFSVERPPPSVEVDLLAPPVPAPMPPIATPENIPLPVQPPPLEQPPPDIPAPLVEKPVFIEPTPPPMVAPVPPPVASQPLLPSPPVPAQTPPPIAVSRPVANSGVTTLAKPGYLEDPLPPYPDSARRAHEQGTVLLLVKVDALGNPIETTVKQTSGYPRLDRAAQDWIQLNYKFQPATINGLPVAAEVTIPIRFSLQ